MKIHFIGAISQKDTFGPYYNRIVAHLEKLGHLVQHEQITSEHKTMDFIRAQTHEEADRYYQKLLRMIVQTDILVAEASFPSTLNVGHEISLALERQKPVIILYQTGKDSFFLRGVPSDNNILVEYNDANLESVLEDAIEYAKDSMTVRFNFLVTPKHIRFLDWIAKFKDTPKAVYLRKLLDREIRRERDFPG